MRAAPPVQVALQRFGVWRGAVGAFAALAAAALGGWSIVHGLPFDAAAWVALILGGAALAGAVTLWSAVPASLLAWDGQSWRLGSPGVAADEAVVGELRVVLDLGPWMLLSFETAALPRRRRPVWLPVQRRGIEAQWHALRSAVYSPRASAPVDAENVR